MAAIGVAAAVIARLNLADIAVVTTREAGDKVVELLILSSAKSLYGVVIGDEAEKEIRIQIARLSEGG